MLRNAWAPSTPMSNFNESVDISERNSAGEAIHVKDTFVSVLLESMRVHWFPADSTLYVPAGNVFPRASKLKGTLTVTLSNAKAEVALADTAARTNIRIIGRIVFSLFIKHLESLFIPIFREKLIRTDVTPHRRGSSKAAADLPAAA
jgi:hypothetical protein